MLVNGQAAICISVVSKSDIQAFFLYECLQALDVGGSTVFVNIGSVRLVVNDIGLRTQCIENTLRDSRCTSVGTVKSDSHGLERSGRQGNKITDITVSSCCEIYRSSDVLSGSKRNLLGLAINVILDLLLNLCFQFVAAAIDDLNSVVIERVMAGGNHDTAVKSFRTYHIGYTRRGGYMQKIYICT